ncbi:MAG: hypothetical protein HY921_07180 [Elusimicrobia bacterium]|nr:hypothetical protein [Elusimicrobiota bacterium]
MPVLLLLFLSSPSWATASAVPRGPVPVKAEAFPGRSGRELPDPPYNFKKRPVPAEVRSALELLGHRFDEKSGLILGPEGAPLSVGQYEAFQQPFNFKKGLIKASERSDLIAYGYRFDEENGQISLPAPRQNQHLTRLALEEFRRYIFLLNRQLILERLQNFLAQYDPNKPLPFAALDQARALARAQKGALPPALEQALAGAQPIAGPLRAAAFEAYLASTRYWDGAQDKLRNLPYSMPVMPEGAPRPAPPVFYDDLERALSAALGEAAIAHLSQNKEGLALLSRFKGAGGKIQLPPFLILKIDPLAGATYNYANKSMIFNMEYVLNGITAGLPDEERQRLRRELDTPAKLARHLLEHPEARQAFFKRYDAQIMHELTHA